MCEKSEATTCEQLTLFAEGSPVKMLVWRGNGLVCKAKERPCGESSPGSFVSLGPDGSWLKTCPVSCPVIAGCSLVKFSETWPRAGMMRSGKCYPQPRLVRHTKETGYLLWRTPTAYDWKNTGCCNQTYLSDQVRPEQVTNPDKILWRTPASREPGISVDRLVPIEGGELGGMNRHFDRETGRMAQIGLTQQVQAREMWPTPRAQMGSLHQPSADKEHKGGGKPKRLEVEVGRQMWPTPDVPNGGRGIPKDAEVRGNSLYTQDGRKVQVGLANAVKMWPTPNARDWRSGKGTKPRDDHAVNLPEAVSNRYSGKQYPKLPEGETSGQLAPQFVEWLMGFSRDWTEVE